MNFFDALVIGTFQGLSLFPAISRSGSTISSGLLLGLKPELAGRFSFLLSIPAILGALILEINDIRAELTGSHQWTVFIIGGIIAGIVGYISIKPLIIMLQKAKFYYFAFYCWIFGGLLLIYLWLNGM